MNTPNEINIQIVVIGIYVSCNSYAYVQEHLPYNILYLTLCTSLFLNS